MTKTPFKTKPDAVTKCNPSKSSPSNTIPYYRSLSGTSGESTINSRLEQMIQDVYSKTTQIIIQSRLSHTKLKSKGHTVNEWFNITTYNFDCLKEELSTWMTKEPLVINIYLETTEPKLFYECHKVNSNRILIESWSLTLNHSKPDFPVDLPDLYKRFIGFFRSLHSLVRLLPGHGLYEQLKRYEKGIYMSYRFSDTRTVSKEEVPLEHLLHKKDNIKSYEFTDITTPLGTIKLEVSYREYCPLDTKTLLPYIMLDINRQQQEDKKKRNVSPRPTCSLSTNTAISLISSSSTTTSSSSFNSSRTQSLRGHNFRSTVSPFKSPSLSASPQLETVCNKNHRFIHSLDSARADCRKIEFSSSFERHKSLTRRGSRASDHKSICVEDDIHEFMKFTGEKQDLRLFQSSPSTLDLVQPSLSHYRNIQEALFLFTPKSNDNLGNHTSFDIPSPVPSNSRQLSICPTVNSSKDDDDLLLFKMCELGEIDMSHTKDYDFRLKMNRRFIKRDQ